VEQGCEVGVRGGAGGLLQLGVLGLGLFQDGYNRICIFPNGKKILIRGLRFVLVSAHGIGSAQLQVRQSFDGRTLHNCAVIENPLKFGSRFNTPVFDKVCLAADIHRPLRNPPKVSQFVGGSRSKQLGSTRCLPVAQRDLSANGWQIIELNDRVIRKTPP